MKKFKKLIGLPIAEFEAYVKPTNKDLKPEILVRPANLIPTLKVGDEMALTSIFLSTIRLVKEFRDSILKDIKFPRSGKNLFFTEVSFPELFDGRIDGMIVNVTSGKVKDVVFFEMKNGKDKHNKDQIDKYIKLAKDLKVDKLVTISNEFVSDVNDTPVEKLKVPKNFNLYHLSWTYILTIAHVLLFENDDNIEDRDQVEIMKEVVKYFESDKSGVNSHSSMNKGWKEIADKLFKNEKIGHSDPKLNEVVRSWHQKEKDLALMLSRTLGAHIKSSNKTKSSVESDKIKLLKENLLKASLTIKDAVSKLDVKLDFIRRTVTMSVVITPPADKSNNAKVIFLFNQLEKCKKKEGELYDQVIQRVLIEPDFKFLKNQPNYNLFDLRNEDFRSHNEIQKLNIHYTENLKSSFSSRTKFVTELDNMSLKFYESLVQHLSNWKKPPPKVDNFVS